MKPELKRIEAALQQAANQYHAELVSSGHSVFSPSFPQSGQSNDSTTRGLGPSNPYAPIFEQTGTSATDIQAIQGVLRYDSESTTLVKEPTLPGFTASQESNGFVALTNSALAINLLQDLQTMVGEWVTGLETVIQQIQALYEEGPIVDGWLESVKPPTGDAIAQQSLHESVTIVNTRSVDPSQTTYRLCGLNEDGQIWCHPCPPEQVPDISWAIVRYQRLRNLLTRKNTLEAQLGLLTETLVEVHGKIAKPNDSL